MLNNIRFIFLGFVFIVGQLIGQNPHDQNEFFITSKPYARYWWFASKINRDDVKYNLDWLKSNGFGGVELACDLISGYAKMDIPEGEAMLFEPEFSSVPTSSALLAGKNNSSGPGGIMRCVTNICRKSYNPIIRHGSTKSSSRKAGLKIIV